MAYELKSGLEKEPKTQKRKESWDEGTFMADTLEWRPSFSLGVDQLLNKW